LAQGVFSIGYLPADLVPEILKTHPDFKLELKLVLLVKSMEINDHGDILGLECITDGEPQWKKAE
jgi:hypothetical protein